MATRLIIDGNSVYEIDEACEATRRNGVRRFDEEKRRKREETVSGAEENSETIKNETGGM